MNEDEAEEGNNEDLEENMEGENNAALNNDAVVEELSSLLITAVVAGDLMSVRSQLEQGADKNETTNKGRTAMWHAAKNGHSEILQLLLNLGANKDKADDKNETPLFQASDHGHLDVVQLLVEEGADIETANDYGWTPLMTATASGYVEVIRYLLEQGADRDRMDSNNFTPLHGAALTGELEGAKLLMAYGADLNARTSFLAHSLLPIEMDTSEEIKQAIRDEPRRRMDHGHKRATEQDRHPTAASSASAEQEEAEDDDQNNKKPRLDGGGAEDGKVADEDQDSEPSSDEGDA